MESAGWVNSHEEYLRYWCSRTKTTIRCRPTEVKPKYYLTNES